MEKDLYGFFFCNLVCLKFSDEQLLIHFFIFFVLQSAVRAHFF